MTASNVQVGHRLPRLLRVSEVAEWLGIGRSAVYNKVNAGAFPKPIKFGQSVRWREADVLAFIDSQLADTEQADAGDLA